MLDRLVWTVLWRRRGVHVEAYLRFEAEVVNGIDEQNHKTVISWSCGVVHPGLTILLSLVGSHPRHPVMPEDANDEPTWRCQQNP